MGKRADDHPVVAGWLRSFRGSDTAKQYAPFVRALVRQNTADPLDLTARDYVAFVLAERTEPRRKKAISALSAFGKYVADLKGTHDDPGRDLTDQVRHAAEGRANADALKRVGLSATELTGLRWRDVLAGLYVGLEPVIGQTVLPRDPTLARSLGEQLLTRLRFADVDTLPSILSTPVLAEQ